MSERYLTAEEVVARYKRNLNWLYHCDRLKKYARKAGKYLVYREVDLEAFELECTKTAQGSRVIRHSTVEMADFGDASETQSEEHSGFRIKLVANQCRIRCIPSYTYRQSRHNNNHPEQPVASTNKSRSEEIAERLIMDSKFPSYWRERHRRRTKP